jgi:D-glycero-D-manno-heptose 1,7-bisphosphate phosphatase
MKRAVFLDRDGVINRVVWHGGRLGSPWSPEEVEVLPRVAEAIEMLRSAGFLTIVVTNQPDVAVGLQRREVVEEINEQLRGLVHVDDIKVCYHRDQDGCACRKPKPGMLLEAARTWSVALDRSFMIGDRWRDIGAGRAAGCTTILVGDGYGETFVEAPDAMVESLFEASLLVLSNRVEITGTRP